MWIKVKRKHTKLKSIDKLNCTLKIIQFFCFAKINSEKVNIKIAKKSWFYLSWEWWMTWTEETRKNIERNSCLCKCFNIIFGT